MNLIVFHVWLASTQRVVMLRFNAIHAKLVNILQPSAVTQTHLAMIAIPENLDRIPQVLSVTFAQWANFPVVSVQHS